MAEEKWINVIFMDVTGAKQIKAQVQPEICIKEVLPSVITRLNAPAQSPDGQPMTYALDHKEGGKRLREDQTFGEANVQDGHHLILIPEVVAG